LWCGYCTNYTNIYQMLRLINELPAHVAGIHAYDHVTEQEYTALLAVLLDELVIKYKRINFILVLETAIANFASGMWCGNVGIGLKHFFRWNKVAIVSAQPRVHGYSDLFKYIIPGKFKNFPLEKIDEAIIWTSKK
jgi:hypothetical protein